ncbi:MAG TPA: hypothetical protein VK452_10265 [Dissulfurispiraceae bacterium]|nr:hypothetical protein [Dissulfurispiraceae bacterium]
MADDDGLRQLYVVPGASAIRQGYLFARTRVRKRAEKKKEFSEEFRKATEENDEEDKKGVDIKV